MSFSKWETKFLENFWTNFFNYFLFLKINKKKRGGVGNVKIDVFPRVCINNFIIDVFYTTPKQKKESRGKKLFLHGHHFIKN